MLTILIPAYENPTLLKSTIDSLGDRNNLDIFIIDDSETNSVHRLSASEYKELRYFRISRSKELVDQQNPVYAWNQALNLGLQFSTSRYLQLRHHDDQLFTKAQHSFCEFAKLLEEASLKIYIIPHLVKRKIFFKERYVYHCHPFLIKMFLRMPAFILLFYNYLGPTSSMVVRSDVLIEFDERLKWLVDVHFYMKMLRVCSKDEVRIVKHCYNTTAPNNNSITQKLTKNKNLTKLTVSEIKAVCNCPYVPQWFMYMLSFFSNNVLARCIFILTLLMSLISPPSFGSCTRNQVIENE